MRLLRLTAFARFRLSRLKFKKDSLLAKDLESTFPKTIVPSTGHLVAHAANQDTSDVLLCRLLTEVRNELLGEPEL